MKREVTMAIVDVLKNIGLWNSAPASETLALNYHKYGAQMGFGGYDEFIRRASSFYDEAKAATTEHKPGYTRVELSGNRVAFDYQCEIRGIYKPNGKPLAFFKPNFKTAGFRNAAEELEDFKTQ
jgi:pyocin large subunit-like protein